MVPSNNKLITMVQPMTATAGTALTATCCLDTLGFDYLQVGIMENSCTLTTQVSKLMFAESDAVVTACTAVGATMIPELSCAAAATVTASNVLPSPNSVYAKGQIYRANIDLRGRHRYISMSFQPGQTNTSFVAVFGVLGRCADGPAQSVSTNQTSSTEAVACRLNAFV